MQVSKSRIHVPFHKRAPLLFLAGLVLTGTGIWWWIQPSPVQPPVYHALPAVSLLDQQGQPVFTGQLQGKVSVVALFFSRCPVVCPRLQTCLTQLQQLTATPYQTILVTTDPSYDTPQRLGAFAAATGAPRSWQFWTGEQTQIGLLAESGLRLSADAFPYGHSEQVVLVDASGYVRGWYAIALPEQRQALSAAITALDM